MKRKLSLRNKRKKLEDKNKKLGKQLREQLSAESELDKTEQFDDKEVPYRAQIRGNIR